MFCDTPPELFDWIFQMFLDPRDEHFHLADLPAYLGAQETAAKTFRDQRTWTRMSILNVARIGRFSSDRTVSDYARDIWDLKRV